MIKPLRWDKYESPVARVDFREAPDGTYDAHVFYHRNSLRFAKFPVNGDFIEGGEILQVLKEAGFPLNQMFWQLDETGGALYPIISIEGMDLDVAKVALARAQEGGRFAHLGVRASGEGGGKACCIAGFGEESGVEYLPDQILGYLRGCAQDFGVAGEKAERDIGFSEIEQAEELVINLHLAVIKDSDRQKNAVSALQAALAQLQRDLRTHYKEQHGRDTGGAKVSNSKVKEISGYPEMEEIDGAWFLRGFDTVKSRRAVRDYLLGWEDKNGDKHPGALDAGVIEELKRSGVLEDNIRYNKRTPIIKVRGITDPDAFERALEEGGFISEENRILPPQMDMRRPGEAYAIGKDRLMKYIKSDAERIQSRIYFWGGNLPNIFSGLMRGNVGEAFMGAFFALPNFISGYLGQRPRNAEELAEGAEKAFRGKDGELDLHDIGKGLPKGRVRFGSMVDGLLTALAGDEAPGEPEKKPSTRMRVKMASSILAGVMSFMGGWKGKKIMVLDENLDPVLGENGRPKYISQKDPALLLSGVLVNLAYGAPVFIESRAETARPNVDWTAIGESVRALPGGEAATEALGQAGRTVRQHVPRVDWYMKKSEADSMKTTSFFMSKHNEQQIFFALKALAYDIPRQRQAYEAKMAHEGLLYFGPGGKFTQDYLGPQGIFQGVERLVDDHGALTQEARLAKNSIIAEYEALKHERDGLAAKDKKGKNSDVQQRVKELDGQLEGRARAYERALLLGCYDMEDSPRKTGFLWRHKDPASYEKLKEWHETRYLGTVHKAIESNGCEETAYKAALSRKACQSVLQAPKFALIRLWYSMANRTAAEVIKYVNSGETVEQNTAELYLDQTRLYRRMAELVVEDARARPEHYDTVDEVTRAVQNLKLYLDKQDRETKVLGRSAHAPDIGLGILIELQRMQAQGEVPDVLKAIDFGQIDARLAQVVSDENAALREPLSKTAFMPEEVRAARSAHDRIIQLYTPVPGREIAAEIA